MKTKIGHPRTCKPSFDLDALDPAWGFAFAGLFFGEGSIQLAQVQGRRGLPVPSVSIHMRSDEKELFDDIVTHLGGWLTQVKPKKDKHGYTSNPQIYWSLTGHGKVLPIVQLLLRSRLLGKKREEAQLMLDYINWRSSFGVFPSPDQKLEAENFRLRLKSMHSF